MTKEKQSLYLSLLSTFTCSSPVVIHINYTYDFTVWPTCAALHTPTLLTISVSLYRPLLLCPILLISFLLSSLPLSLSPSHPPTLPLILPASCCSGPPGSYSSLSDKRMDRTTKKKEGKRMTAMDSFVLSAILSPILPCCCHSLSHPLSLSLGHFSVLSLRESSWSLISQSCLTVTHTVSSAQLQQQWPTS